MIGVLGSGSWATAIVKILLESGHKEIAWWVREPEARETITTQGYNPIYLTEAELDPARLRVSGDIREVVEMCDDIFVVIPSVYVASALSNITLKVLRSRNWISATKGLVSIGNLTVTQYLQHHYGVDPSRLAIVSGPSHAEEVARKRLCYLTVGSSNEDLQKHVTDLINCSFVKSSTSFDVNGIEYAAALKNVYAVAMGIARGMGLGDNLIAVFVASAVREMRYFLNQVSPMNDRDVTGYAYLGDLRVTCYSQFSRNRTFGQMIGHGYSIASAKQEMNMVAEGYYAVEGLERIREAHELELPILQAVYSILYRDVPPRVLMRNIGKIM